jgi:hypothetical protein
LVTADLEIVFHGQQFSVLHILQEYEFGHGCESWSLYLFMREPRSIGKKLDADLADERRAVIGTQAEKGLQLKGEIVGSCTVFLA